MQCSERADLQQRLDSAWDRYRRVEAELRQACEVYVATGRVTVSPPTSQCYREWLDASRALDRHLSSHRC